MFHLLIIQSEKQKKSVNFLKITLKIIYYNINFKKGATNLRI